MIDKSSDTWQTLSQELDKEIAIVEKKIFVRGLSIDDTQYWRGYHAAMLKIKDLPNPPTLPNVTAAIY